MINKKDTKGVKVCDLYRDGSIVNLLIDDNYTSLYLTFDTKEAYELFRNSLRPFEKIRCLSKETEK